MIAPVSCCHRRSPNRRVSMMAPASPCHRRSPLMPVHEELPVEKPSLYDRLGGVYNIATVVDDLIDRIMVDPRLNANPRVDEAHHRVSPAGFKYLVTEMVCWAAGGPQTYAGRSMAEAHRDMMISAAEW